MGRPRAKGEGARTDEEGEGCMVEDGPDDVVEGALAGHRRSIRYVSSQRRRTEGEGRR
jgi:hypothetical protein